MSSDILGHVNKRGSSSLPRDSLLSQFSRRHSIHEAQLRRASKDQNVDRSQPGQGQTKVDGGISSANGDSNISDRGDGLDCKETPWFCTILGQPVHSTGTKHDSSPIPLSASTTVTVQPISTSPNPVPTPTTTPESPPVTTTNSPPVTPSTPTVLQTSTPATSNVATPPSQTTSVEVSSSTSFLSSTAPVESVLVVSSGSILVHISASTLSDGQVTSVAVATQTAVTTSNGTPLFLATNAQGATVTVPFGADPSQASVSGNTASGVDANSTPISANSAALKSNHAGAIAGGVIGALFFILLVLFGLFMYRRHRQRARVAPSAEFLSSAKRTSRFAFGGTPGFQFERVSSTTDLSTPNAPGMSQLGRNSPHAESAKSFLRIDSQNDKSGPYHRD